MLVLKYGNMTPDEFNALPSWLQHDIYKRWVECFGGMPFDLTRLYWYDPYKISGFVFDYRDDINKVTE